MASSHTHPYNPSYQRSLAGSWCTSLGLADVVLPGENFGLGFGCGMFVWIHTCAHVKVDPSHHLCTCVRVDPPTPSSLSSPRISTLTYSPLSLHTGLLLALSLRLDGHVVRRRRQKRQQPHQRPAAAGGEQERLSSSVGGVDREEEEGASSSSSSSSSSFSYFGVGMFGYAIGLVLALASGRCV